MSTDVSSPARASTTTTMRAPNFCASGRLANHPGGRPEPGRMAVELMRGLSLERLTTGPSDAHADCCEYRTNRRVDSSDFSESCPRKRSSVPAPTMCRQPGTDEEHRVSTKGEWASPMTNEECRGGGAGRGSGSGTRSRTCRHAGGGGPPRAGTVIPKPAAPHRDAGARARESAEQVGEVLQGRAGGPEV